MDITNRESPGSLKDLALTPNSIVNGNHLPFILATFLEQKGHEEEEEKKE